MGMKNAFGLVIILLANITIAISQEINWEDVYYTSGPYKGGRKVQWKKYNVSQKTQFLELHLKAINYCISNMGEQKGELDPELSGRYLFVNTTHITPLALVKLYRQYGNEQKAAQIAHKYWVDSNHNPILESAEEDPDSFVIDAYVRAGMYKEAIRFYNIAHEHMLQRLSIGTDVKLLKTNFREYEQNWPEEAAIYDRFVKGWREAKQLAKTANPKSLDPAVQHHEWFYSDKQQEVLKALEYYHKHDVSFMLEKALKHKNAVIAAKAKEYLANTVKGKEKAVGNNEAKN